MARYDDLNTGTITLVGIISSILTFVIIVAGQVLYFQYKEIEHRRKFIEAPLTQTQAKLEAQRNELNNYTWIDQEKGTVSIPIEEAKQEVLKELTESE